MDLWKTSGHFEFYGENMFDQMKVENEEYQLRPMNCPFHIAIFKVSVSRLPFILCQTKRARVPPPLARPNRSLLN